jgi:Flp pilus assembly protein TadG
MKKRSALWLVDRRGIAAVEFALIVPVLLLMLGGVADFGLLMVGKGQLANGLAQGAQYALLQGPSVSGTTVQTVVRSAAARSGVTGTVTVNVTGPACYCVTGKPAALTLPSTALSASHTCTGTSLTCPSPAAAPGAFLIIKASYAYQPLMPLYSKITTTTVSETVTARLK